MKIQLIDKNKEMCDSWRTHFKNCPNVIIHQGDFFSLQADCIVSPANSFGFMDGGLDGVITNKIGIKTQEKLRNLLAKEYFGELLVGQAVLIETEYKEIPYCISAPTMRVPLSLKESVNVYLAAKAVFRLLIKNPQINIVTISGLGTGVGHVPFDICALQMKKAYDEAYLQQYKTPNSWKEAQKEHMNLITKPYRYEDLEEPGEYIIHRDDL